jgi:IS605 OrfB family transposase
VIYVAGDINGRNYDGNSCRSPYGSPFDNAPDQSSFVDDVGNIKYGFSINKESEMYHIEKIQRSFSTTIHAIGVLSNNLKRRAVFIGRQIFFLIEGNRKGEYVNLAKYYPELANQVFMFMEDKLSPELHHKLEQKLFHDHTIEVSSELKGKLRVFENYDKLYHFLKNEQVYLDLKHVYSPLPQQILRYVASMWLSYREGILAWWEDPTRFTGKPNIPNYHKYTDEFKFGIPGQYIASIKYAKGIVSNYYDTQRSNIIKNKHRKIIKAYTTAELRLPPKFMRIFEALGETFPTIRTTIDIEKIHEIRFIPRTFYYTIEIVYAKEIEIDPDLDRTRALSIDIGVNILAALTTNFEMTPVLIRNSDVKSTNQWMNKRIAQLRSIQTQAMNIKKGQHIPETIEMKQIRRKRDNIINDCFHKVSRKIIDFCQTFKIQKIAIGYNSGWKQKVNMGKRNNQNFYYIPFAKLIHMIQYKAYLVGIEVKLVNEHHTSKCSALDFEPIQHHDRYSGKRGIYIKGRNKQSKINKGESHYKRYRARGLFCSAKGYIIHSDVNGSFNIGRVAYPELFNEYTLSVDSMRLNPISIKV